MTTISPEERVNTLINQLREMRLPVMATQLRTIYMENSIDSLSLLEVLEQTISEEFYTRKQNTINKNRKAAKLSNSTAHLSDIHYSPERKINVKVIEQLATNYYLQANHNVIIQGATGTGKSFIANALGNNALDAGYSVHYYRMTELFSELHMAQLKFESDKKISKLVKTDLLIIDDFLLTNTNPEEQKYLMEIFELRNRVKPILLCSQMSAPEWHKKLGGGAMADAILDRAISNAYQILISGESQRRNASSGSLMTD